MSRWVPNGFYKTHSLVLRGDAGLGKTPVAMAMLSEITDILHCDHLERPYYIKVGTVDALRDAFQACAIKP